MAAQPQIQLDSANPGRLNDHPAIFKRFAPAKIAIWIVVLWLTSIGLAAFVIPLYSITSLLGQ